MQCYGAILASVAKKKTPSEKQKTLISGAGCLELSNREQLNDDNLI
jgi:hypothetical protein